MAKKRGRPRKVRRMKSRRLLWIGTGIGIGVITVLIFALGFAPEAAGASIALKDEQGNPITASKIILDGTDLGSATGEVEVEELDIGDHTIIIVWSGVEYTKTFHFSGEEIILIQLANPVSTHVSVWNEGLNEPIPNVKVYVDGERKGTTDADGECIFTLAPGDHTFRLSGNGVSYEGIRSVSAAGSSINFVLERITTITVSVFDELTGSPVKDAEIYLDGVYKGETSTNGRLEIGNVTDGIHQIGARYDDISESESVTVSSTSTSFSLSIAVPTTITVNVLDELTGEPVGDAEIYLDAIYKGETSANGSLEISDVEIGSHQVRVQYGEVSETRSITVSSGSTSFNLLISVPKTITVELKDCETKKQISGFEVFLQNSRVYKSTTKTDDYGKAQIKEVFPGDYQLFVDVPMDIHARSKPSKLITVAGEAIIPVEVDMPNPKFEGGLSCRTKIETRWGWPPTDEVGYCRVSLKNIDYEKGMTSADTSVLLFVFVEESEGNYELVTTGKRLISFDRIAPGESKTSEEIKLPEFEWRKKEIVVAVVVEGWDYAPQNLEDIGEIHVSASLLGELVQDVIDYCKAHPEVCLEIIERTISGIIAGI